MIRISVQVSSAPACFRVAVQAERIERALESDHSSWGVYCCAVGSILEERYERLDDG